MLVLSRKRNESITIDDDIVITVVEIRGDKVRLGIQAPRERSVHRREVHEAIFRELYFDRIAPARPTCPEEADFLAAIRANPRDVALLQVYADWLEERGDARSERIREHCRWIG